MTEQPWTKYIFEVHIFLILFIEFVESLHELFSTKCTAYFFSAFDTVMIEELGYGIFVTVRSTNFSMCFQGLV